MFDDLPPAHKAVFYKALSVWKRRYAEGDLPKVGKKDDPVLLLQYVQVAQGGAVPWFDPITRSRGYVVPAAEDASVRRRAERLSTNVWDWFDKECLAFVAEQSGAK